MELKVTAYPKVNINLYVGNKRPDGFHSIASVFHIVRDTFYKDEIIMSIEDTDKTAITVKGLENIADCTNNTVYKAIELYLDAAGLKKTVSVFIHKNIPSLAGLGGGSSDAGFVLKAMNNYYNCLSYNQLVTIASKIGSDVPFFVCDSDVAVVSGRGEVVQPIEVRKDIVFKLFSGNEEKKSTGFAYEQLDLRKEIQDLPSVEYLKKNYYGTVEKWDFNNDFSILYSNIPGKHLTGSGTWRFSVEKVN